MSNAIVRSALLCGALLYSGITAAQPQLRALPIDIALHAAAPGMAQPVALSSDHAYVAYIACDPRKKLELDVIARAAGIVYDYADRWFPGCRLEVASTTGSEQFRVTSADSHTHAPSWSPDGQHLAYVEGGGQAQRLHVWNRASKNSRKVFARQTALLGSALPIWLPDSRHLLVISPRENPTKSALPANSSPPSSDTPAGSTVRVYRSAAAMQDPTAAPVGPWALDEGSVSLVIVDIMSGESRVILPHAPQEGGFAYELSPDGARVAYAKATRFVSAASQQTLKEVHVVSLSDGEDRAVAQEVPMAFGRGLSWSPDSHSLAWITAGVEAPYDLTVHSLKEGTTRTIRYAQKPPDAVSLGFRIMMPTDSNSSGISAPVWNANGRELYALDGLGRAVWKVDLDEGSSSPLLRLPDEQVLGFVRNRGVLPGIPGNSNTLQVFTGSERTKQISLREIDLSSGRPRTLWIDDAQINDVARSADGRALAYFRQTAESSPEVWFRPMPTGQPRRISSIAREFDPYLMGKSRLIEWSTARGERVQGVLITPSGYKPKQRYPLIVFAYGSGFKSHSLHHFAGGEGMTRATTDNIQLLATRGYAVLLPDVPGRTGTVMKDYADAILPGVDRAIEAGIADPEGLGIMGHSNGGFTVMALIAQSPRFKAAVSRSGFSDQMTIAFAMDAEGINYGLNVVEGILLGSSLWEARSRWIDNSPLFFFDRVQTPTLIVHGGRDDYVTPFAADQAFTALRRLGKIVEYAKYANEGHNEELWSEPNQVDYLKRMMGWFDRFLCPQRTSETACR